MGNSCGLANVYDESENIKKAISGLELSPFYPHLDELKTDISGTIITPDMAKEYSEARNRVYNFDQRGYPLIIVRPSDTKDVATIIRFVNKYAKGVTLCVASGCHSARCMQNDAFVIDLVHLNKTKLLKDKMVIEAGGGCYLEEVDKALVNDNLGVTVGTYPYTGIGGLVTAAGIGHLGRLYGFSCDNVVELEVVLANGDIVIANDDNEYSDLIWGIRGGGGNFGIVTKFTLKVHQLPSKCFGGIVVKLAPTISSAASIYQKMDRMLQVLQILLSFGTH